MVVERHCFFRIRFAFFFNYDKFMWFDVMGFGGFMRESLEVCIVRVHRIWHVRVHWL